MLPLTRSIVLTMLVISILFGCASPPIRSNYLQDIPVLKEGEYLDKVWFHDGLLKANSYSKIQLGTVQGLRISDQTNITVDQAVRWLREATLSPGQNNMTVLSTGGPGQIATLELVITELNPGSTAARFWAGEYGAGHAWVQVEGKLFDADNQKLLAYFVERDRKSGVATLRNSRGYDSG